LEKEREGEKVVAWDANPAPPRVFVSRCPEKRVLWVEEEGEGRKKEVEDPPRSVSLTGRKEGQGWEAVPKRVWRDAVRIWREWDGEEWLTFDMLEWRDVTLW
jgi:hypothetical protein